MSAHLLMRNRWRRQIIFLVVIALSLTSLIAVPRTQAQLPACAQKYIVKPGDNLFRIGLAVGTNYLVLAAMNGISNPNLIFVGQVLCLPGPLTGSPAFGLTLTPVAFRLTVTPISTAPCLTQRVLTVRVSSFIYYAPDPRTRTPFRLILGSRFPVCTNITRTDWVPFRIGDVFPLWVPAGVFG